MASFSPSSGMRSSCGARGRERGARTPVGRYGGSLSHIRTDDLLGQTMVWACEDVGVDLDRIEDIAAGCVNPAHEGMGDIARWAALAAGFPDSVPAATVNRFCA